MTTLDAAKLKLQVEIFDAIARTGRSARVAFKLPLRAGPYGLPPPDAVGWWAALLWRRLLLSSWDHDGAAADHFPGGGNRRAPAARGGPRAQVLSRTASILS